MFTRVVKGSGRVKDSLLGKIEDLGDIEGEQSATLDDCLDLLHGQQTRLAHSAYLELAHKRGNLLLQSLICDLAAAEINLVANENDGNLMSDLQSASAAHINALLAEQRQPVLCDTIKARRIGDRVNETDNMCATQLRE
jgi:hypothetical protein